MLTTGDPLDAFDGGPPGPGAGFQSPFGPPPAHLGDTMRTYTWIGAALWMLLFAIAAVALGLGIWAAVTASNNRRALDDAIDSGLIMRGDPTQDRHTPLWDTESRSWLPGHGRMADLEDVTLGTKKRPLEDGDLLRWERGRVVNARDPAVEQELGHHLDTKFSRPLRNGDIVIRNESAGQWQNAPLSAMLALQALSDVDLSPEDLGHGSSMHYDRTRSKWTTRPPQARAWLRFCAKPDSDPAKSWGRVDGLRTGSWSKVRPSSPEIGIYALNIFSRGGMDVSRKHVSITTPKRLKASRPSAGRSFHMRAVISAQAFPAGAWGFLVGNEVAPKDGGFQVQPLDPTGFGPSGLNHWTIESLRPIGPEQEISLAFLPQAAPDPKHPPRVQCLQMSVEEP